MKKRIIAAAVLMIMFVHSYVPIVSAANEMIIRSSFTASINDNTAPNKFDLSKVGGDYTWNTSFVKGGMGGKDVRDYAFFIKTTDYDGSNVGSDSGADPFLGYWYTVNNQDVTLEASLYAPAESMRSYMVIGINNGMNEVGGLYDDGSIRCHYTKVGSWKPGRWYKMAVTYHAGTKCADYYLNGEKVLENTEVTSENITSFTRIKLIALTTNASTYNHKNNLTGYDNIRWYIGNYDPEKDRVTSDIDSTIYLYEKKSVKELCDKMIADGCTSARIYKDDTFSVQQTGNLEDGNVLVVSSENGEVLKYSDIADMSFSSDFDVDNSQYIISVPETITVGQFLSRLKGNCSFKVTDRYGVQCDSGAIITDDMKLFVISNNKKQSMCYSIAAADKADQGVRLVSSIYNIDDSTISGIGDSIQVSELTADLMRENKNEYLTVYGANGKQAGKTDEAVSGMTLKTDSGKAYRLVKPKLIFSEDFESYPSGKFSSSSQWQVEEKAATGGRINVESADGNKFAAESIVYTSSAANDAFIQSKNFSIEGNAEISLKICRDAKENGWANIALRDGKNSAGPGTLILFSLFEDKISYLPNVSTNSGSVSVETISTTELSEINIRITGKKIEIYKGGILKAAIDDYTSYYTKFDAGNCSLRVQAFVGNDQKCRILCDDIKIYSDSDYGIASDTLSIKCNGTQTAQLQNGTLEMAARIHNRLTTAKNVRLEAAVYEKNVLKLVKMSDPVNIGANSAENVTLNFTLSGVTPDTVMKVMAWSDDGDMIPMGRYKSLIKSSYSAEEIKKLFDENSAGVHPRIIARGEDFERIKKERTTNSNIADWSDYVIHWADNVVHDFTTTNTNSWCYIGYLKDDTGHILEISRRVKLFSLALGMAYRLTGDTKYADKTWDIISTASEFPDWDPNHFLDTAEMTAGFAIAYDWMFDYWTDEQKKTMESCIMNMGLTEGEKGFNDKLWWTTTDNNWNVVCNGGLFMGAAAIADEEPEAAFSMMEKNVRCVKNVMQSFAPDGAWFEGAGYWHYAVEYLAKMVSTCESTLGSDLAITDYECFRKTQSFILGVDGNNGLNNFHDSGSGPSGHLDSPEMFWISKKLDNTITSNARLKYLRGNVKAAKALDLLWYVPGEDDSRIDLPRDSYFRDVEVLNMRSSWESGSTWLSAHAGKAAVNHSHLDCGAFVFDSQGESFAVDLGSDSYALPGYFDMGVNAKRWTYYRLRADGHNTLVINPSQKPDQDICADTKVTKFVQREVNPYAVMDLSSAYPGNTVYRGFMLADGRQSLIVRDEINLAESSTVYWFMNTRASINEETDGVVLEQNGKKIKLSYLTNASDVSCRAVDSQPLAVIEGTDTPNPEGQFSNEGYKKIMIKIKASGKVNITVKLTPIDGRNYTDISDFDVNVTNWHNIKQ
ncbi:MAG: heparinase II/III family protein [Firmicutes bacterium]|nr:heparinase II/III family protein [Bacillota bacterium]